MAEEAWIVAFDIKDAGSNWNVPFKEKLGAAEKATVGLNLFESEGLANAKTNTVDQVVSCKMVELKANTEAEAIEVARSQYMRGANATPVRAVVKPNTNFKITV